MTTPTERTTSLRQASKLIKQLQQRDDVPTDLREQAMRVLRHYPEDWMLEMMAEDWQAFGKDSFGLAPIPK